MKPAAGFAGVFYDGKTAARHEVRVLPQDSGLRIQGPDGAWMDDWPYDEIELLDSAGAGREVRLRRRGAEARLGVTDPGVLAMAPARLSVAQRRLGRQNHWRRVLPLMAGVCLAAGLLWLVFPLTVRLAAAVVPVSWEEALGDWALGEALQVFGAFGEGPPESCESPAGRAALEELTERLAAATDAPYGFRVLVIDVKMVNAFALPGGTLVVFRGLLDVADSPDELSGVVAHEMGHVIRRHGTEAIFRSLGLSLLVESVLGGAEGGAAGALGEAMIALSYSRDAEAEADREAVALLRTAGLRADGLAAFFGRLSKTQGELPGMLELLSTHPGSAARAEQAAREGGAGAAALTAAEWRALKDICGE
jgi:Zn-dependent protease with chaperone function